jgi:hypothetical protein
LLAKVTRRSLSISLFIVGFHAGIFLPLTFIGPAEMRNLEAWFGGTHLLYAVVLYGLWHWNSRLMACVALGIRVDA